MPNRKCFVPNCNSGYASCKQNVSLFAVTKNRLHAWSNAIPRKDRVLSTKDVVCEKHFEPECVIRAWKAPNCDITVALKKCKLTDDALPTIFPNCPYYVSKHGVKRKSPTIRHVDDTKPTKTRKIQIFEEEYSVTTMENLQETTNTNQNTSSIDLSDINLPSKNWTSCKIDTNDNNEMLVFSETIYSNYLKTGIIRKKITVLNNAIEFYYGDKKIIYEDVEYINTDLMTNVLHKFSEQKICSAGASVNEYKDVVVSIGSKDLITSTWRHNSCAIVLKNSEICKHCVSLNDSLRIACSRQLNRKSQIRQKLKFVKGSAEHKMYA